MLVKHLVRHGNSRALVIDRSILQAAGLSENCLFHIVVDSNSGITIQSVKPESSKFEDVKGRVLSKYEGMLSRLSDR